MTALLDRTDQVVLEAKVIIARRNYAQAVQKHMNALVSRTGVVEAAKRLRAAKNAVLVAELRAGHG